MRVEHLFPWIGIVGSRKLEGSAEAQAFVRQFLSTTLTELVISGGAKGIDTLAVTEARALGIRTHEWLAQDVIQGSRTRNNWIAALFARNTLIARDCDVLVAITVRGGSSGTADTVKKARAMGKQVIQVEFDAPTVG